MMRNNAADLRIDSMDEGGGAIDAKGWVHEVYCRYDEQVFRVCMRFANGDRAWALDCTQDVFLRLLVKADTVRAQGEPMAWLYRVAVNVCCMKLRRRSVAGRFLALLQARPAATSPSAETQFRAERAATEAEQAIAGLPVNQRAVMVLMHLDNKTQTETAELLGISQGQVSKLRAKAVQTLRQHDWDLDDA